jgi:D-alanyl-D-alanine carboxypeptidase
MPNPSTERDAGQGADPRARRSPRRIVALGLVTTGAAAVALAAVIVLAGGGGAPAGRGADVASGAAGTASPAPSVTATAPSTIPASNGSGATPTAAGSSATPAPTAPPASAPVASPGFTAPPTPTATPDPAALAAGLDARLEQLRKKASIPGISAAILWDDGRTWLGAAGSADILAGTPITKGTAFALASVSKTFTAAVVLQLVEEGRLGLDRPVAPLLPAYRLDRRITVRMLLDHTSGLPDYFLNPTIDKPLQAAPDALWTPARAWGYVLPKRATPGTTWRYSNANYLLLGELVHAVTGRSLAVEIRRRLLQPLRLTTAWYQVVERPRARRTVGYRMLPAGGGKLRAVAVAPAGPVMPFRSVISAAAGAGSMAATARDAARWMQAFAGGRVLSADMQSAMLADMATTTALGARIAYGLGIESVALDGHPALGHSGRYLGFRNVVLRVPDAGVTIAVLTNQSAYNPSRIAALLLRMVAPPPVVTLPPGSPSPSPSAAAGLPSPSPSP